MRNSPRIRFVKPMRDGDTLVIQISEPIVGVPDLVALAAEQWRLNNSLGSPLTVKASGSESAEFS